MKKGLVFLVCLFLVFLIGGVSAACPNGVVSYWGFDDNLGDMFGGNDGSFNNMDSGNYVAGQVGNALIFNGVDEYVNVGNDSSLNFGSGDFTYSAWIKTSASDPARRIIAQDANNGNLRVLTVNNDGNGVQFVCRDSGNQMMNAVGSEIINDGGWHHVVGVREGQTAYLYVDGVLNASDTNSNTGSCDGAANTFIGARNNGAGELYFNGEIDEVGIYSRALSLPEIEAIRQKGLSSLGVCECSSSDDVIMKLSSSSNAHGAFWDDGSYGVDVCYSDIFGVAGNGNRACVGANKILGLSDSVNAHAQGPLVVGYLENVCYGSLSCVMRDNACEAGEEVVVSLYNDSNSHVMDPNYRPAGLISEWNLDGDALDSTGNNNGTVNGVTPVTTGKIGGAYDFDGIGDYIEVQDSSSLDISNEITLAAWIKPSELINEVIVAKSIDNMVGGGYRVMVLGGKVFVHVTDGGGNSVSLTGNQDITTTDFSYIVASYDNDKIRIYVDGVLDATSSSMSGALVVNNHAFRVGIRDVVVDLQSYFSGVIDEVAVFDRVLTPGEIGNLYNVGAYEKKICCSVESVLYWADADGVAITSESPNVGDTVQAIMTNVVAAGTFDIWENDGLTRVFDDVIRTDVVGVLDAYNNLIYEWTITRADLALTSNDYNEFYFNVDDGANESGYISINDTYDDSVMNVTIVSPECGGNYSEGDEVEIVVSASDEDDFLEGNVSINGVIVETFVNGGVRFDYTFSSDGNFQIVAEAINGRGKMARHIANIMVVDIGSDGSYVAACIAEPKDFSEIEESVVTFNASTTRGIKVSGGVLTEFTPVKDPTSFSWYWEFIMPNGNDDVRDPFVKNDSSLAYYFNYNFPTSGQNSAALRVVFD